MYKVIKNARYGFYENDYIPCGEFVQLMDVYSDNNETLKGLCLVNYNGMKKIIKKECLQYEGDIQI